MDGAEKLGAGAADGADGFYVNGSYDLGEIMGIQYKTPIFVQYENYNPVSSTVDGQNEDTYDTEIVTVGLNFFPVDQAVLKVDYAMKDVNGKEDNIFSFGLGFIF